MRAIYLSRFSVGLFTRGIRLGQQVLCSAATKWRTEVERITEKASSLQPGEGALLQLTPFCLVLVLSSAMWQNCLFACRW